MPQFPLDLVESEDRPGRWSDHISFLQAGIPAVRLTEDVEDTNRQHNSKDTSEVLDYNYLRQVAQLNVAILANIIGAPARPLAPTVTSMANAGAYILTWAPDPGAAGYAISFRPMGTAEYPPFRFVNTAQAGNVALTGLDSGTSYAVSMAALGANGRIGLFSPEIFIGP
jgi:hypothetical protein